MTKLTTITVLLAGLAVPTLHADKIDSAVAVLTDARCAEVKTENMAEITCFLSFPDSVPNLFYELMPDSGLLVFKLISTKTGGIIVPGQIDTVNQGPVATMVTRQETLNKNEAMPSLTPEWYSVVLVTLSLNPMIRRQEDLVVSTMENAITISFPWPDDLKTRRKLYTFVNKPRRRGLVASLIGVGTAGLAAGGYLAYRRYFSGSEEDADPLEPVMPEHPASP
jgi:hypothetical protein